MCEFIYCKYNHNSFVIRVLQTIEKSIYLTIFTELNNIFRFFVDFFVCDIRRNLVIFNENVIND